MNRRRESRSIRGVVPPGDQVHEDKSGRRNAPYRRVDMRRELEQELTCVYCGQSQACCRCVSDGDDDLYEDNWDTT
jgi:hypothetical protein